MHILNKIPVTLIYQALVLETFCTIVVCYLLAVANEHVRVWLPMISACAVSSPEKYIFRIGIVLAAVGIFFKVVTVYNAHLNYSKSTFCLFLGTLASASNAIVGVVNEDEARTVHACELQRTSI